MIPRSSRYIAAFLRRHWDQCKTWDTRGLLAWVQWFVDHERCLVVTKRRRIICVTLYRRVHEPQEVVNPFGDSSGPVIYVEVTASTDKRGMKGCYNLLKQSIGRTFTHICWFRAKHNNRFTIITTQDAERHLVYG